MSRLHPTAQRAAQPVPPFAPPRLPHGVVHASVLAALLALLAAVTFVVREDVFTAAAAAATGSSLEPAVRHVADAGVLTMVGAVVIVAVGCWLRERRAFHRLTGVGVGVVGAYAVSELVKLLVQEERPCRALDVSTVLACPGTEDWSWPSNHATVAAALAVACFFAVPRLGWLVAPLAALVAAARVAAGVHYAHDVLAGLALGVVAVTVAVVALHGAR